MQGGSVLGFTVAVMAFIAELFPTSVRFTGASLAYQLGSTIGAGMSPAAAAGLVLLSGGGIALVGATWIGALAACLGAVVLAGESRLRNLERMT